MSKILMFCAIIFCLALAAMAKDYPRAEIFGGFSAFSGSLAAGDYNELASRLGTDNGDLPAGWGLEGNLLRREDREQFYGFQTDIGVNFHDNLGIVGDIGYQTNDLDGQRFHVYEYLVGPQFSMRGDRATVFAHALFGGSSFRSLPSETAIDFGRIPHFSDSAFAMGLGGGVDVNAGGRFAVRVVQIDWIPNKLGGDWSTGEFRLGFGLVFKAGN